MHRNIIHSQLSNTTKQEWSVGPDIRNAHLQPVEQSLSVSEFCVWARLLGEAPNAWSGMTSQTLTQTQNSRNSHPINLAQVALYDRMTFV